MSRSTLAAIGIAVLILLTLPFVYHASQLGIRGLGRAAETSRVFTPNAPLTNVSIFAHMLMGAVITLLAPLQIWAGLRAKRPKLHRWVGRTLVILAFPTALGGFGYIFLRGTIGGTAMDIAFAAYGALLALAAVQTIRFARARNIKRHNRWAMRFFFLIIGSWIYRVHYGLWFATVGRAGHTSTFDGPFDLVQNWAFFLPYLILVEAYYTRRDGPFWIRN